jgi:hypothetical protein
MARPEEIAIGEAGVGVAAARAEEARCTRSRQRDAGRRHLRKGRLSSAIRASPAPY